MVLTLFARRNESYEPLTIYNTKAAIGFIVVGSSS